jgi:hypothetical protein
MLRSVPTTAQFNHHCSPKNKLLFNIYLPQSMQSKFRDIHSINKDLATCRFNHTEQASCQGGLASTCPSNTPNLQQETIAKLQLLRNFETFAGSEVLKVVVMKISIFWDIMLQGLLKINQWVGRTCRPEMLVNFRCPDHYYP